MSQHAKFSPSKAHRWTNCYGSIDLESVLPDSSPSKYAIEGTGAHEFASNCLRKQKEPIHRIGKIFKFKYYNDDISIKKKIKITEEMAQAVQSYYDYIKIKSKFKNIKIEKKVFIDNDLYGTADCYFMKKHMLFVVDYKHGKGVNVDVKKNLQLAIYALGVLNQLQESEARKIKKIIMVIVQPRTPGKTIKKWVISRKNLESVWLPKIMSAKLKCDKFFRTKQGQRVPPQLKTGDWCKWCKAHGVCPQHYQESKKIILKKQELSIMDYNEIRNQLDHIKLIRDYLDALEKYAYGLIMRGKMLPGYKLVEKTSRLQWTKSEEELIEYFKKWKYNDKFIKKNLCKTTVKTPTQLAEILDPEKLDLVTVRKSSGLTLVSEADKRKAANSLVEDFKDE